MRTWIFCVTTIAPLLWAFAAPGQSANQVSAVTDVKARPESPTTLLARSDMQTPKSIPVIRPLRFQEIPAGFNVHGDQPRAVDMQATAGGRNDEVKGERRVVIRWESDSGPKSF